MPLSLNGTSQYASYANASHWDQDNTNDWSITARIYKTSTPAADEVLFATQTAGSSDSIVFGTGYNRQVFTWTGAQFLRSSNFVYNHNEWFNITQQWEVTSVGGSFTQGNSHIYVNETLYVSYIGISLFNTVTNNTTNYIGQRGSGSLWFNGKISGLAWYPYRLSTNQLHSLSHGYSPEHFPNRKMYMPYFEDYFDRFNNQDATTKSTGFTPLDDIFIDTYSVDSWPVTPTAAQAGRLLIGQGALY